MMKPLHGAIALTICGIAIWAVGMLTEPQVRVASEHATEVMTGQVAVLASFHQDDQTDIKLNELKTFRGASADGLLRTDLQGNLIIDMALKRLIDFYLSARGELPLDDIIAAMHSEISQLIQPGQQQAMTLLDNYLGYLAALGEYDEQTGQRLAGADFDAMAARLQWQQRLRREWLQPDVVEAFFAEDEAIDSYTLERIRVARAGGDPAGVSDDVLPQNIRDMRERSRSVISMRSSEADMRAAGAGDDEIHSWRVATFGEEVAQRLAAVDEKQQAWRERLREYKKYTDSLAVQQLGDTERERLLNAYKNRYFSPAEIKRIPAALSLLASDE